MNKLFVTIIIFVVIKLAAQHSAHSDEGFLGSGIERRMERARLRRDHLAKYLIGDAKVTCWSGIQKDGGEGKGNGKGGGKGKVGEWLLN